MERAISVSGAAMSQNRSVEEIFSLLQQAGYSCADFWLYRYCLNEDSPMAQSSWREWVNQVRLSAQEYHLTFVQAHALFNIFIPEDFRFVPPDKMIFRNIEAGGLLSCGKLVFHPLFYPYHMKDREDRERIIDYNIRWFSLLLDSAKQAGIEILLENTFDFAHCQTGPEDPPFVFSREEDMQSLLEGVDSTAVGLCLDTGHANIAKWDIPAAIHKWGERLKALHLNDNYGLISPVYEDLHLFPGYGSIQWQEVFSALLDVGFTGALNIEPSGELGRSAGAVCRVMLSAGREILTLMAGEAGL